MSAAGPTVTVRFWAGARRAAGRAEGQVVAPDVRALKALLGERPELAKIVAASSLLVDGTAVGDDTRLDEGAVVDVLPPFAGG